MKTENTKTSKVWYRAKLTPAATGLFTDAFYPEPKKGTGSQYVFFTEVGSCESNKKVVVASRFVEAGIRMMTKDLAQKCLIPGDKATKSEMLELDNLSENLKL
jgi:hypothetical protein